jgi:hypothetical protein
VFEYSARIAVLALEYSFFKNAQLRLSFRRGGADGAWDGFKIVPVE